MRLGTWSSLLNKNRDKGYQALELVHSTDIASVSNFTDCHTKLCCLATKALNFK